MDRRTFLKATGGLAAGAALSPEMLRAATSQVKHIVVPMMEKSQLRPFSGLAAERQWQASRPVVM
jgi:TAT (twin-arginine translocation) pathway signal sequence